jgi:hypothetical protein
MGSILMARTFFAKSLMHRMLFIVLRTRNQGAKHGSPSASEFGAQSMCRFRVGMVDQRSRRVTSVSFPCRRHNKRVVDGFVLEADDLWKAQTG